MGQLVKPSVFLVGYQDIDYRGLRAYLKKTHREEFLKDIEEAISKGISGGEILCSIAAKICYRTLVPGENSNVGDVRNIEGNLKNGVLKTAHGSVLEHAGVNFIATDCSRIYCYAEDTEVYTSAGWKGVGSLTTDDELLTLNPTTKKAEWERPTDCRSFPYNGDVFGWSTSQMTSPLMTPDHVLWLAWHDKRRARGLRAVENIAKYGEKMPFSEAFGKSFVIENRIDLATAHDEEVIKIGQYTYDAYDLFCWLGWLATDGSFSSSRPNCCAISQVKTRTSEVILCLMTRLFPGRWRRYGPHADTRCQVFKVSDADLASWARSQIGPNKVDRKLSTWLLTASPRLLRGFFEAVLLGDGTRHAKNGHRVLYCPSLQAAGQYQVIAAMLHTPANLRVDDRVGESHPVGSNDCMTTRVCYVLDLDRRGGASLIRPRHQHRTAFDGKVFCPVTRNGLIFVRGSGQPFWAGNTHELVRHRAGAAYSQTSGRYCRLDSIDLVWDDILDGCEDLVKEHLEATEDLVYMLECRKGLRKPPSKAHDVPPVEYLRQRKAGLPTQEDVKWVPIDKTDKMPMAQKKKLTSAIRRVAPNGQSNEIFFTLNIRSARHTVLMRTSRHSEWEIRYVFAEVYRLLKEKFPVVFSDAREVVVDGLLEVQGMRMQPYEIVAGDPELLKAYSVATLEQEIVRRTKGGVDG